MKKLVKKGISILMTAAMVAGMCTIQPKSVEADVKSTELYESYVVTTTADDLFEVVTFTAPYDESYTFTCEASGRSFDAKGFLFDSSVDVDKVIATAESKVDEENSVNDWGIEGYIEEGDDENDRYPVITSELEKGKTYSLLICGYRAEYYGKTEVTISLTHGEPIIKERTIESCEEGGYTGDLYCSSEDCGKLLEKGKTVDGHTSDYKVTNAVKTTCYADGYSGDSKCTVCGHTEEGKVTEKTSHNYVDNVCEHCGNIESAKFGEKYALETTEELPYKVVGFTASFTGEVSIYCEYVEENDNWDGYGYLFKGDVDVDNKISAALQNIQDGNIDSEYVRLSDAITTDDDNDETSLPEIVGAVEKGQKYYFVMGGYNGTDYGKFAVTIECTHKETEVKNVTLTDCTEGGYTGDVYCKVCEGLVSKGQQIKAGEHTPAEELVDVCEATCLVAGYTGDVVCDVCSKVITEGKVVEKKAHEYENDVCKICNRVQNAKVGDTYTFNITEDIPYQVVEFTAAFTGTVQFYCDYIYDEDDDYDYWDGYGYLFDDSVDIDSKIATAITNIRNGNTGSSDIRLSGYIKYSDDGNDGLPVIEMNLEKDQKYYFVLAGFGAYSFGSCILEINCMHEETEVRNKKLDSCEKGGYSGDTYCTLCEECIEEGVDIAAGSDHSYNEEYFGAVCNAYAKTVYTCKFCDHSYTKEYTDGGYGDHGYEVTGYVAPTCTKTGESGTSACIYCGDVEYESTVIKAYHDQTDEEGYNSNYIYDYNMKQESCMIDGYTGDVACTHCNEVIEKGLSISATGHKFKDGYCKVCGIEEGLLPISKDGYYEIASADDLVLFMMNSNKSIKGKLVKDITVPDDYIYENLDSRYAENSILDGDGHTISNWNLDDTYYIFSGIYDSAIKNLTVEVSTEFERYDYFGVITPYAENSTFENITINGNIVNTADEDYQGGIVGYARYCEFTDCVNNADITAAGGNTGGIVGDGEYLTFTNCVNNGDIYAKKDEVGGIAGEVDDSTFTNCKNTGNISTCDEQAGGIAGNVYRAIIKNCTNDGDILYVGTGKSKDEIGGIVGSGYDGVEITDCVNNGNVGGTDDELEEVGGIIGQIWYEGKVINCINNGDVSAPGCRAGGIVGDYEIDEDDDEISILEISGCVNNGKVYSMEYAGGIIGEGIYVKVENCINNGSITGDDYVAGIIGYAENATVNKVFNTGQIGDGTGEGLVNGDEITITNSDANHTHKYDEEKVVKPATTTEEGVCEILCACGDKITKTIEKIDETTTKEPTTGGQSVGTTTTAVKNPAKTKITSAKNVKTKKIKLSWKKLKGVKGYQIRYSTSKKFKKAAIKTIKKNKAKFTIKKLKKKKYYVQVRAYKVVNGKTYVGKWSKKKAVNVKK